MMPIYTIVLLGLLAGAQSKSVEHALGEHLDATRAEHAAHVSSAADAVDSSRSGLHEVAAVLAKTRDGQLSAHEVHAISEELSRRGFPTGLLSPLRRPNRPLYRPYGRYRPGFKSDESHVERLAAAHISSIDPVNSNSAEELVHLLASQRDGSVEQAAAVLKSRADSIKAIQALHEAASRASSPAAEHLEHVLASQRDGSLEHAAAILKNRADSIKAVEALHEAASRASSPAAEHLENIAEAISRASAVEAAKGLLEPAHARNAPEQIAAALERANSLKALHELHESARGGIQAALEHAAIEHAVLGNL